MSSQPPPTTAPQLEGGVGPENSACGHAVSVTSIFLFLLAFCLGSFGAFHWFGQALPGWGLPTSWHASSAQLSQTSGERTSSASALLDANPTNAATSQLVELPPANFHKLRGKAEQFSFISSSDNGSGQQVPARWNPCQPINYRINPGRMQPADINEVRKAFDLLGKASGLQFHYVGPTNYIWTTQSGSIGVEDDTDLTFSFARSGVGVGRSDLLGSAQVVGVGGPIWQTYTQGQRIIAGRVVINSDVIVKLPTGTGAGSRLNAYLHELGHAVGLDHVSSRSQLMFPTLQTGLPPVFGAGDVAGLRALGAGSGCWVEALS